MKKYTPYIFPLIVVVIVFFLVYRWYSLRTQRASAPTDFDGNIQIEELSPDQLSSVLRGTDAVSTTELEPTETTEAAPLGRGSIRYMIAEGRVNLSVSADLPESELPYRVWVRSQAAENLTEAFILEVSKGGYMGSASISETELPLEVLVSTATQESDVLNSVLLKGNISVPQVTASPSATPMVEEAN